MVETVCAKRKTTRIAGSDFPHEVVRSRFLKVQCTPIEFVMECLREQHHLKARNMKQYLLAPLLDEPMMIGNHYTAKKEAKSRYLRRRLVNSRFSAARKHREKGFCHETTSCLHYGSLEQQPV